MLSTVVVEIVHAPQPSLYIGLLHCTGQGAGLPADGQVHADLQSQG